MKAGRRISFPRKTPMESKPPTLHPLTRWLQKASPAVFSIYAISAAFTAYFCMYAFRKPFTVAEYKGYTLDLPFLPAMDLKIALLIAQVFGYMLSKFIGIKVISEMSPKGRAFALLVVIGIAEIALLLFALTPRPYNLVWMFINGIPLGMVWGLVFGFLEGRKLSELLGAGLSASYILASGFVKSAGQITMSSWGVSEFWMPFVTGLLFLPLFFACVWMLQRLPPPTAEDEALRTKRVPMQKAERAAFFKAFAPGLLSLIFLYVFLTAFRDFRDNFAREIWTALGYGGSAAIFTSAEIPIAFGVLFALALLMLVKDNRKAMILVHLVMFSGTLLVGLSSLAFQTQIISGRTWMILIGLGLYLAYVPFGCVLFDRLIAAVRYLGNAGFLIYLADSFGYLGSVSVMLFKNFASPQLSWLHFFLRFSYLTSALCCVCFLLSLMYFLHKAKPQPAS